MNMRKRIITVISGGLVAAAGLWPGGSAQALSGSDFQAGRIIDDGVFYDSSSLTVAQIQAFLASQVPVCDTNGDQPYYGTYNGVTYNGNVLRKNLDPSYPPPYTCLKDYMENTSTKANNIGHPSTPPDGAISAAQIIWNEAQNYHINPKVLLVLIQKESLGPLTTDDWPWPTEYKAVTGYGCPDATGCDSTYYGFYNQVHLAARQFRLYADNPNSYNYVIGTNLIKYHPDPSSCGTQQVNIVNQATANLYNYTPYVPNQAALNNLYGLGDGCSSYGNRNFWRIFNDWFGSTFTPSYASQFYSQTSWPVVIQGGSASYSVTYRNVGADTWYDDVTAAANGALPVHLSTARAINRRSALGANWNRDANRPAVTFSAVIKADGTAYTTNPHIVAPGESATFTFTLSSAGVAPGTYREYFQPIVEGGSTMNDPSTFMEMYVQPQTYSSAYAGQSAWPVITQGQTANVYLQYRNTGNMPWYDDATAAANGARPVHLATSHGINRGSALSDTTGGGWCNNGSHNRAACTFAAVYESDGVTLAQNQHVAQPGQIARFAFTMTAFTDRPAGTYREFFQPIVEGGSSMNDPWTFLEAYVQGATYSSSYYGQSAWPSLSNGASTNAYIMYRNTGSAPWYDKTASTNGHPVVLAASHPVNRASAFADTSGGQWCGNPDHNRAACTFAAVYESDGVTLAQNQHVAQPGQIAKFAFPITAGSGQPAGTYREFFQPILEGMSNMNDPWTFMDVYVH